MDKWYQSPEQGGRIIGEVSHFIDTLQYLLDADPVEVFASSTAVGACRNKTILLSLLNSAMDLLV